jgi:hypothetical protein
MTIDPHLSPADAAVALRSLDRRYRAVFLGHEDDEAPDELAHRQGPDGWSALAHVVAAARGLATCSESIARVIAEEAPVLEPSAVDPDRIPADPSPTGSVDERVSELAWEADALADQIKRVPANRWGRSGRIAGTGHAVGSLDLVRAAVEAGVTHLKAAEQTLEAARRQGS